MFVKCAGVLFGGMNKSRAACVFDVESVEGLDCRGAGR